MKIFAKRSCRHTISKFAVFTIIYNVILRRTVKYLRKTGKRLNIIYLSFSLKCMTLLLNGWSKMYI